MTVNPMNLIEIKKNADNKNIIQNRPIKHTILKLLTNTSKYNECIEKTKTK